MQFFKSNYNLLWILLDPALKCWPKTKRTHYFLKLFLILSVYQQYGRLSASLSLQADLPKLNVNFGNSVLIHRSSKIQSLNKRLNLRNLARSISDLHCADSAANSQLVAIITNQRRQTNLRFIFVRFDSFWVRFKTILKRELSHCKRKAQHDLSSIAPKINFSVSIELAAGLI